MAIREKCQPHLWLLTGTGEGHVFTKSLLEEGWEITVSVVSERASIPYEKLNLEKILIGALISEEDIRKVIFNARHNQTPFHCVIDMTHPFATKITKSLSKVCKELNQSLIRYERPIDNQSDAFLIKKFSDLRHYDLKNKSIFFAIGARHLKEALSLASDLGVNVYARVLSNPESLRKTLSSSILETNFAVLNPSVHSEGKIEKALIRKWNIDGVVCRQSGGGNEMLWHRICSSMGIDLWLLERPYKSQYDNLIDNYEKLIKRLKSINMD